MSGVLRGVLIVLLLIRDGIDTTIIGGYGLIPLIVSYVRF